MSKHKMRVQKIHLHAKWVKRYVVPVNTEDPLVDAWRGLLTRYSKVSHELERALQAQHSLTVSDFEVLDRLVGAQCKARVNDLLADLHLTQSAVSRAVARLEKCGIVERNMCDTDRRGVNVVATDKGRALHAAARETQLEVLRRELGPEAD